MKKLILFALPILLGFASCSKEETLSPSYKDIDWYKIENYPEDELQKLRYEIYRDYGVSLFFSDTIGSMTRYNLKGEPFTFYKMATYGYSVTSSSNGNFWRMQFTDSVSMQTLATFLRDEVFEGKEGEAFRGVPKSVKPRGMFAYSILDQYIDRTLVIFPTAIVQTDDLLLGNIDLSMKSDDQKKELVGTIKGILYAYKMMRDEKFSEELESFFAVISTANPDPKNLDRNYYSGTWFAQEIWAFNGYTDNNNTTAKTPDLVKWNDSHKYGLIQWWNNGTTRRFPDAETDLADFIGLYLGKTSTEVTAQYGSYPLVMQKYNMIEPLLTKWAATHQ